MNGDLGTVAGRGEPVRLALRLIVEEALEGEVSDALGRARYERGEGEKAGYRTGKVKTAEGAVDCSIGPRHAGAVRFSRAGGAFGPDAGTRAAGGRALRARPVDAGHRGRVHRRDGPTASVAGGGERDHRKAVGRMRGFLQARSF